ncbi:hypothetical protein ACFCV3_23465 [Kribbella sp. NPDC056345]|uniref:hypothetical protein n=1 Tax=Kribbella sp. NPDC056345 TaxID=3345789 RepID=UPI0035E1D915
MRSGHRGSARSRQPSTKRPPAASGTTPDVLRIYRAVHLLLIANAHDADPYGRDDAVGLAAALLN